MKYLEAFKTTDRFEFYKAIELLEFNNIEFQILHEYRLQAKFNFDSEGEPAILRVQETDLFKVENLLMEAGLMSDRSVNKNINTIKSESVLDEDFYRKEIKEMEGKRLVRVCYILANSPHFDFGEFHSIDYGIVLEFESGKYLSWKFEEEDEDFENDTFIPQRYDLVFSSILPSLDKGFKIIDVSGHEKWARFIQNPVTKIDIYSQGSGDIKIISHLILSTHSSIVSILSTDEPHTKISDDELDFSIGNEWAVVVFK